MRTHKLQPAECRTTYEPHHGHGGGENFARPCAQRWSDGYLLVVGDTPIAYVQKWNDGEWTARRLKSERLPEQKDGEHRLGTSLQCATKQRRRTVELALEIFG